MVWCPSKPRRGYCDFSGGDRKRRVFRAAALGIYLVASFTVVGCDQGKGPAAPEKLDAATDTIRDESQRNSSKTSFKEPKADIISAPPQVDLEGADKAVVRAVNAASEGVRDAPDSAAAWGKLGMTLLAHEYRLPAAQCFERAAALDVQEPRWPYLHARSILLTDPIDAVPLLEQAAKLVGNDNLVPRLVLAELLLELGQPDDAERHLRQILSQEPDNARAFIALARIHFLRGNYHECRSSCRSAAASGGTRKEATLLMANAFQREGATEQADALRTAADAQEDFAWPDPYFADVTQLQTGLKVQLVLADRLFGRQKTEESIAVLKETVKEYPESVWAKLLLGRALIRARQLPEADGVLKEALRLAPNSVEAHFRLGVILNLQRRFRDAAQHFQRAVELKPDFTMAHYNLAYARREMGDMQGAIDAYRRALSCQPDLFIAHAALGDVLARKGYLQEGREHLETATQLQPDNTWARSRLQAVIREMDVVREN